MDTYQEDLEFLRESFDRAVSVTEESLRLIVEELSYEAATRVANWNKKAVTRVFDRLGIQFYQNEPWLDDMLNIFAQNNAHLIKSNNMDFISKTQETVYRNLAAGRRHEVIRNELFAHSKTELGKTSVFRNAKHRASVIARDQVNKINGDLTRLRQERTGVKKFIWRSAGDNRVRPLHRQYNGEEYTWKTGAPKGNFPGQDIMCRCYAEPVLE